VTRFPSGQTVVEVRGLTGPARYLEWTVPAALCRYVASGWTGGVAPDPGGLRPRARVPAELKIRVERAAKKQGKPVSVSSVRLSNATSRRADPARAPHRADG